MAYDKLKPDNKQLGRKAIRILQLNLRFCIFLSMIITIVFLIVYLNLTLNKTPKYLTLNQYVSNLFNDPYQTPTMRQTNSSEEEGEEFYADEFDYIWSDESIELFQKQLGIEDDNNSTKTKTVECHSNMQFIMSALPGPNDDILSDIVWQYFSLLALESQTIQYNSKGEKLYLKAFVTEKMRTKLNELFEGLPLQTFTILPSTCYNLKYAEIIGNNSPISLKEIALASTPLLLDPKAKRIKEIAQLFGSKMRPFFR
ncbi:CLUMA_CG015072, isoform A [Clunio marinus]|uniref:CLUMA_CG015072, isoform A n=1 Tax=Clunio marinus TaxID=568069 RepID=A0A1J1ISE2_9DIPT|nr:CLUMA_CG015072, isoform A [Clunio marinus]